MVTKMVTKIRVTNGNWDMLASRNHNIYLVYLVSFWSSWGSFGTIFGRLGGRFGHLEGCLGTSWAVLGRVDAPSGGGQKSMAFLGRFLDPS